MSSAVADPPAARNAPAPPAPGGVPADGDGVPAPRVPTEQDRVEAAVRALKTRGTPHQVRARLIAAGCDPDTADRIVTRARAKLLADSRKLGATVAEWTVLGMCGALLLLFVPGGEVLCGVVQVIGMIVLAVAALIWLSGGGGD